MADATRLQTLSKQSDERRQATEVFTTQIEKRTQSQAQIDELIQSHRRMEAMMAALMSQRSNQLSRPPDPPYSASGDLTSYSQAPQPPDPPDIRKSRQDLTIKAPDPPDLNQSEPISAIQIPNKLTLRYSCEEIHERMTNGLCIFCEELDTPGHYNLKHKKSQIVMVKCDGDESPDDEKPDEATVEEISNKPVNMIHDRESNPENESRSEVSLSQFQVFFSSLEPSHRCHNHYESLDVVDKDMCDEPVCDKDGDYTLTVSAKSREIHEDSRLELVCLKQSHDTVENHLDNFGFALTRSSLQHTPTDQYGAPFSPYQNCNDTGHYKREFGNYIEPGIEFDRASEEVEDDELQDKQSEDEAFGVNVETLVMNEDKQPLECDDLESWSPPLEDYGVKSQQQHMNNTKVILRLVIPVVVEHVVKREKDYDGALLAPLDDTVAFSKLVAQQLRKQQLDPLLMLIRMIMVPFSTLILMTCKVLELIKDKASKKRKLCKNWWFKYKLNTWLSEAFHFWKYENQMLLGYHGLEVQVLSCLQEFAKTFILAIIDEHKDINTACVFLERSLNRERLKQWVLQVVFQQSKQGTEKLWVLNEPMIGTGFSLMKNIESLKEHEQLEDAAKGIRSYESNIGHVEKSLTEFSVYGVFHLQRPPELG